MDLFSPRSFRCILPYVLILSFVVSFDFLVFPLFFLCVIGATGASGPSSIVPFYVLGTSTLQSGTFSTPTACWVQLWGGGGPGGAAEVSTGGGGGGGSAGSYVSMTFQPGATFTYSIGGGPSNSLSQGSGQPAWIITSGGGNPGGSATGTPGTGAAGGPAAVTSPGNIPGTILVNVAGSDGADGGPIISIPSGGNFAAGGVGGSAMFGGAGGLPIIFTSGAINGNEPGGGGAGQSVYVGSVGVAGGASTLGMLLVTQVGV